MIEWLTVIKFNTDVTVDQDPLINDITNFLKSKGYDIEELIVVPIGGGL